MMEYVIALIGIAASLFSTFILMRFGGRGRINEIQAHINKVNKEYSEAVKAKDEKRTAELEKEIGTFPKLMMESTFLSLKGLIVILPLVIAVPWAVRQIFPIFTIQLPFDIPVPRNLLTLTFEWKKTFGSYGWYWLTFIFLGGAAQLIISKLRGTKKV